MADFFAVSVPKVSRAKIGKITIFCRNSSTSVRERANVASPEASSALLQTAQRPEVFSVMGRVGPQRLLLLILVVRAALVVRRQLTVAV